MAQQKSFPSNFTRGRPSERLMAKEYDVICLHGAVSPSRN